VVGRGGAEAGPGLDEGGLGLGGEGGEQGGGAGAEIGEVGGIGGGVETGVFMRRADEGCSGLGAGGAWDDVDVFAAVDFVERQALRNLQAQHLAFDGDDGEVLVSEMEGASLGPGAGGEDDALYAELFAGAGEGGAAARPVFGYLEFGVLAEVDGGGADGGEEGDGELAGVEGLLGEAKG